MKKTVLLLLIFLIVLIAFSSFFWLYEVKFMTGRASVSQSSYSIDNSYVFVTPLKARANGQEKIRITVFVLNNQGIGVMGKKAFVALDPNLNVESVQGLTDSYGKAFFDVSANKAGEYFLEVKIDDTPMKQKAHLSFN